MDRRETADPATGLRPVRRVPDAAQSQLSVDLRRHPHLHAGGADRHRHRAGDALRPDVGRRLRQRREDHARRELGLAAALFARGRRLVVLPRRLYPYAARALLRLLQGAARSAVDSRRAHSAVDGGHRLHGLLAGLGADELLGGDGDHQSVLVAGFSDSRIGDQARRVDLGRLRRRRSDAEPALCAALSAARS